MLSGKKGEVQNFVYPHNQEQDLRGLEWLCLASVASGIKEISSTVKDIHESFYFKSATKGYNSTRSVRTLF